LDFIGGPGFDPDAFAAPAVGGVGGAIEIGIVDDDELPVFRVVVIEFDEVSAGSKGEFERREGIFGSELTIPAMPDDEWARTGQEAQGWKIAVSGEGKHWKR
jgi:hypothetical protein